MRRLPDKFSRLLIAAATLIGAGTLAGLQSFAQDEKAPETIDTKYDAQLMEEIIVRGENWRAPRPDPQQWRSVNPTVDPPSRTRMSLGYDAAAQRELRSNNPLHDLSGRTIEPATVIRFRF